MKSKWTRRDEKGRYEVKGYNRRSWDDNVCKKNTRQILEKDTQKRYDEYLMDTSADTTDV